jgi:hypothetical protein
LGQASRPVHAFAVRQRILLPPPTHPCESPAVILSASRTRWGAKRVLLDKRFAYMLSRERFVRHTRIIVTRYGGPDALQVVEEECVP